MSESVSYPVRWRGIQSGPFSLASLERQLEDGHICLWHEVLVEGRWIPVEDLLKSIPPSTPVPETKSRPPSAPAPAPQASPPSQKPGMKTLPRLHPGRGPDGTPHPGGSRP